MYSYVWTGTANLGGEEEGCDCYPLIPLRELRAHDCINDDDDHALAAASPGRYRLEPGCSRAQDAAQCADDVQLQLRGDAVARLLRSEPSVADSAEGAPRDAPRLRMRVRLGRGRGSPQRQPGVAAIWGTEQSTLVQSVVERGARPLGYLAQYICL